MKTEAQYIAENTELKERNQKLEAELFLANSKLEECNRIIQELQEKLNIRTAKIFSPKTETEMSMQIDEAEGILEEEKKERKANRGKKQKQRYSVDELEKKVNRIIYIDPDEKVCPTCGSELVVVSESVSYKVIYHSPRTEVIKYVTRSYKCKRCNSVDNRLYRGTRKDPFPKSLITPSMAAFIVYTKFVLGVPFERMEEYVMRELGIPLSKQVIAHAMQTTSVLLFHIVERMKKDLLSAPSIHVDETPLVISRKPEKDRDRKKSYMFVYLPSFYSPYQMAIYSFNSTRAIAKTKEMLSGYKGYLVCDDYSGYKSLIASNPNIRRQYCFCHARRRFADILKGMDREKRRNTVSQKMVSYMDRLFEMEREYRKERLTPDEILERRKKEHPPILEKIEKLMKETQTSKGSSLDTAMNYLRDNFECMKTYLESGYVEISNNAAERCVKPFVVLRKVFQTCGSYSGAEITGDIFSLVRSAIINGLDPRKYFEYCLEHYDDTPVEELVPYYKSLREKLS